MGRLASFAVAILIAATPDLASAQVPVRAANAVTVSGARCDGATDDYAAISASIQRAAEIHVPVLFPPSVAPCMLSHSLNVPSGMTLRSAPGTVTLMALPDNASTPLLLNVHNDDTIVGLSFDGGGRDEMNGASVIQGFMVRNVLFDRIAVRHTHGIGMVMSTSVRNVVVKNSVFEDIGNHWKSTSLAGDRKQGLVFCCGAGNSSNAIENDHFADIGLDAVQISDQTDASVTSNDFDLKNGERDDLRAPDYPAAIFSMHVYRATINDNVIEDAIGNCIDAPSIVDSTIARNAIDGCGAAAIGIFDARSYGKPDQISDRVTLSHNTFRNYGLWEYAANLGGFTVGGIATNLTVSGNTFGATRAAGSPRFAIFGLAHAVVTGLSIQPDNRFEGAPQPPFGGTLSAFNR